MNTAPVANFFSCEMVKLNLPSPITLFFSQSECLDFADKLNKYITHLKTSQVSLPCLCKLILLIQAYLANASLLYFNMHAQLDLNLVIDGLTVSAESALSLLVYCVLV